MQMLFLDEKVFTKWATMIAQLDPLYIKTRPNKAITRVVSHLFFQGRFLTTQHRWLNRFILAELALIRQLPTLKLVEKPIFIVGIGRSGSTILGKVLSMHKALGFLDEPKALWYSIWNEEDVSGHFSRGPARYRMHAHDVTSERYQAAHRIFGFYLAITRSERVLDKNPELVFRIPFVRAIFPDAKFIFLVRNGWDTVTSIASWSRRFVRHRNGAVEDWWGINRRKWEFIVKQLVPTDPLLASSVEKIQKFSRHEDMAAVEWIVTMQEGLRAMQLFSDSVHIVRFEGLPFDPRDTLRKIMTFCELADDEVFLSFAERELKSLLPRGPVELAEVIREPFFETMQALNYSIDG